MAQTIRKKVLIIITGWVSMIAFDFFLHAGLLARLYLEKSPFLLSPEEAFLRIPFGYFSFLLLSILLFWLLTIQKIKTRKKAAKFGLLIGCLTWGSFTLGLFSISTANIFLLVGWWIGQTLELAIAGYVMGAFLEDIKTRKIIIWVVGFFILMVVLTIILQVTGFAPAMKKV